MTDLTITKGNYEISVFYRCRITRITLIDFPTKHYL